MKNEKKTNNSKSNIATIILMILFIAGLIYCYKTGLLQSMGQMTFLSITTIVNVFIALIIIVILYNLISRVLAAFTKKRGRVGTMSTLISSLTKYITILVGFCWIASIIGVNVSTIFGSIGILALIIGFGAESLVADLVTGIFILFENEYNVGDIIEVDNFRGVVKEIGIRTMSLEDNGGNIKIINNSDLKNIINRSHQGSRSVVDIDVSYDTDLEALDPLMEKILNDIKAKYPEVFIGNIQYLGVENLGASAITLRCAAEVNEVNIFSGRRILNKELKIAFDKNNINIPFPQLDVHNC